MIKCCTCSEKYYNIRVVTSQWETNKGRGEKMEKRWIKPVSGILLLIVLACILGAGCAIWDDYRDEIMDNQKQQLLLTSEILAESMELSLNEYRSNLAFLEEIHDYKAYLETKNGFECELFREDEEGTMKDQVYGLNLGNPVLITKIDEKESIFQYEDRQGRKYLVFKRRLDAGGYLCLAVDEERYYRQLVQGIRIGTNGYIMVKNSEGLILMHPVPEQWGIHVIAGREKLYPELDFTSLKAMVEEQCSGKKGITEYYSYWWASPKLSRVKKISAYAPVQVAGDFWVISSVVDYDDFCSPVEAGFRKVSLLFIGALAAFVMLIAAVGKLLFERGKAREEITALREMNEKLEEIHQGEEMLAHQQRLQVMGTMTGGIAHEFNNFLTPIMGHAELLMMEFPEESDAYDSAREIYEASEKAKDVVRQIASLSRKNVETIYKSIPAKKPCTRVLKMAESICPANVRLEGDVRLHEECILGNGTQMNQVILNICVNAVHAIGKKEGYIHFRADTIAREELFGIPDLETSKISREWERYIQIDIEDNGCGMDKDTLRQIFIPFFTTKKAGEGTGLGLALAEQIITSHKGYMYAESTPGEGTVFHIFLPVLEEGADRETISQSQREKLKIVIADDNAKILQMLGKNFSRLDLQVFTCRERKELHRLLEEENPDVLVIDERIEDGSGVEFCMSVQGKYPDMIKIIMVDCFTKDIVEAKQKKVIDGYLAKPVSDTAILETVRNCRS